MSDGLKEFSLYASTACFALAILHTFLVKFFHHWANQFSAGSVAEIFFRLLGEVEVVFGVWAGVFLMSLLLSEGTQNTLQYLQQCSFNEPIFVFVILVLCSTRPILNLARKLIQNVAKLLPFSKSFSFYVITLILGPLFGSLITEPAAMTLTALILFESFFNHPDFSNRFKYTTIGILFVNVSIGGTLTPFAAPPVLMVASTWGWDLKYTLLNLGWKGALATVLSTAGTAIFFRKELEKISLPATEASESAPSALWVSGIHLIFLTLLIMSSHQPALMVGCFLFFIGFFSVTRKYQNELKVREGFLVAFFLGGLVILGKPQSWWLESIVQRLDSSALFLSAIGLTAFVDNAALTFLGAQIPSLSETSRYALVAGSVVGGGLTVIANAPNPIGFGILNPSFGNEGISPLSLFFSALPPTLVAALCFWLL